MARISGIKRLAMGFGVMALGVLGALPFRHAPPPEMVAVNQFGGSQLTLGDGVSLQVPGQVAVPAFQTPTLEPLSPEPEPEPETENSAMLSHGAMVKISPPPRLPDQYQPLFQSNSSRQDEAGRVVGSTHGANNTARPLRRHSIHDGDTLASLAQRYLDDPRRANEIFEANRALLPDPDLLPIGVQIVIPRKTPGPAGDVAREAPARRAPTSDTPNLVPLPTLGFRARG